MVPRHPKPQDCGSGAERMTWVSSEQSAILQHSRGHCNIPVSLAVWQHAKEADDRNSGHKLDSVDANFG